MRLRGMRTAARERPLSMRKSLGWVVGLAALVLLATSLPAAAKGTLDQSQTCPGPQGCNGAGLVFDSNQWAQTFTAGINGNLNQVNLLLYKIGSPHALTVQIQSTTGGVPSGTVLASATVLAARVPTPSENWVSVPFSQPAPSSAGVLYAIVLSAPTTFCPTNPPGPGSACWYGWGGEGITVGDPTGNPYPQGQALASPDGGVTWVVQGNAFDFAFQTFVAPRSPKKGG